jgi:hypothetical protein
MTTPCTCFWRIFVILREVAGSTPANDVAAGGGFRDCARNDMAGRSDHDEAAFPADRAMNLNFQRAGTALQSPPGPTSLEAPRTLMPANGLAGTSRC